MDVTLFYALSAKPDDFSEELLSGNPLQVAVVKVESGVKDKKDVALLRIAWN
jgi:hypothetical protein